MIDFHHSILNFNFHQVVDSLKFLQWSHCWKLEVRLQRQEEYVMIALMIEKIHNVNTIDIKIMWWKHFQSQKSKNISVYYTIHFSFGLILFYSYFKKRKFQSVLNSSPHRILTCDFAGGENYPAVDGGYFLFFLKFRIDLTCVVNK